MKMRVLTRFATSAAATALAIAPFAAQANTRAGDYSTTYSNELGEFGSRWTAQDFWFGEDDEAAGYIYALIGGAALIIGIILLSSGNGDEAPPINQSPGAN